eukprot:scaffold176861_cov23-Cyclotella_meneghiniana.AAC.1
MGGQTKGHNWAPKLSMRFWNFGLGNSHTMYSALTKEHTPFRKKQSMPECVKQLAHSLMQTGPSMRKRAAEHPEPSRNLTNIFDFGCGRKQRADVHGEVANTANPTDCAATAPNQRMRELRSKQKKHPWRIHQSVAGEAKGRCSWGKCPGIKRSEEAGAKRCRGSVTHMYCEECTASYGKPIYLCNAVKSGSIDCCHFTYHQKYHKKQYEDG